VTAKLQHFPRNSDLYLDEEETVNLLKTIEHELRNRSRGDAVRLEVQQDCPRHIANQLLQTFNLIEDDLYQVDGPINFLRLMPVISEVDRPDLKLRPFVPAVVSASAHQEDIFSQIRHKPILLRHPYESFQTVLDFIERKLLKTRKSWQSNTRSGPNVRSAGCFSN
jgi:polyphosphate kinase